MSPEAMSKRLPKRVAITIDFTQNAPWHFECYRGIMSVGIKRGWTCVLNPVLAGLGPGRGIAEYDGVVGRISVEVASAAKAAGVPVVNHWVGSPVEDIPWACPDVAAGYRLILDHLLDRGYHRVVFISVEGRASDEDFEKVAKAAQTLGMAAPERADLPVGLGADRAPILQVEEWLAQWRHRSTERTGVISLDANVAAYFAHACHEFGIRVPEDIGIVVRDGVDLVLENCLPNISALAFDYREVGCEAARMLESLMHGDSIDSCRRYTPPTRLIIRESTA